MTINQKLALFAFVLGMFAIFLHDPLKSDKVTVDLNDLTLKIQDKSANVDVVVLADWLIKKKSDFVLIDLRDESKYKEYNIPSSINVLLSEITNLEYHKTQKIIIYSDDDLQTGQIWVILKSKNYKSVYLLSGGLNEWKEKILFPKIPENATAEEKVKYAKIIEVCKYFGGTPIIGEGGSTAVKIQAPMPQLKVPSAATTPAKGKAKREGC